MFLGNWIISGDIAYKIRACAFGLCSVRTPQPR